MKNKKTKSEPDENCFVRKGKKKIRDMGDKSSEKNAEDRAATELWLKNFIQQTDLKERERMEEGK